MNVYVVDWPFTHAHIHIHMPAHTRAQANPIQSELHICMHTHARTFIRYDDYKPIPWWSVLGEKAKTIQLNLDQLAVLLAITVYTMYNACFVCVCVNDCGYKHKSLAPLIRFLWHTSDFNCI